jgi:hypothetical protein
MTKKGLKKQNKKKVKKKGFVPNPAGPPTGRM